MDARIETAGRIGGFPFRYGVWQILRLDEFRPAEDQRVLDGVGELTHITWPGAGDEGLHRFGGNSGDHADIPEPFQKMFSQQRNVLTRFGKGTGCGVPRPATYNKGPAGTVPVGSIPPCCDSLPRRYAHRRGVSWLRRRAGTSVPGE